MRTIPLRSALGALLLLGAVGCDERATIRTIERDEGRLDEGDAPAGGQAPKNPKYVVGSVVFSPDGGQLSLIQVLDSLEPQTLDPALAIELPGWADLWVHEGYLYVSDGESPVVTRYSVGDDGQLVPAHSTAPT